MSVVVFLGAGFSHLAGTPLAGQLFDEEPLVDRISRQTLIARVYSAWQRWHHQTGGVPEEFLAQLHEHGDRLWPDAVWYAALVIALRMGRVELVGSRPTITRHNINRTTGVASHEALWTEIFRRTSAVSVITTNYDVLAERGLRIGPRPRVPRPGFHYGNGPESLEGGGYPSYSHIQRVATTGTVPLLKLHGSVSWSYRAGQITRYHDCRPAIRGDALIVAPMTEKRVPTYLQAVWELASQALEAAQVIIVVGYSLPPYDQAVLELLRSANRTASFHVFDPNELVPEAYESLLQRQILAHPGLPSGTRDLDVILEGIA